MATKAQSSTPQLTTFLWEGTTKRGEKVKGEQTAVNAVLLKSDLRRQGITPKKVKKKPKPLLGKRKKRITPLDITIFSRQMATMMAAGIPLVQSFDIVGRGSENESVTELVSTIKSDVEAGNTFAESLAKHPKYFNELFCNLVDAGEKSGSLEMMLDNLATYKEKTESLKAKIKKALFYPTAVIVIAFCVSAALLIFVVPQFESLFAGFGAELPFVTRFVIDLSEFFQAYWYIIFGSIGGAVYAFLMAKQRSPAFQHGVDRAMLRFPIIGPILEKAAIARFARTLSITFSAGLPLVDALKSVSGATGNVVFGNATITIRDSVSTGQQLQSAMKSVGVFPNMIIQMVAIGEESGSLEEMLSKVADFYEEDVDNAVDGLSSLIEPLIMALLGVIVGGLVIAMYMPIFKLGSVV